MEIKDPKTKYDIADRVLKVAESNYNSATSALSVAREQMREATAAQALATLKEKGIVFGSRGTFRRGKVELVGASGERWRPRNPVIILTNVKKDGTTGKKLFTVSSTKGWDAEDPFDSDYGVKWDG